MDGNNWIYRYFDEIKPETSTVGRWIRLVYEYIVGGLESGEFFYDADKANAAVDWIETHCFHTEGPLATKPLVLELWQKAFISSIYGLVDAEGRRQFRNEDYGSRVFCLAPKLEQADLVYNDMWQMTTLDPEYKQLKEIYSERDCRGLKVKDDSDLPKKRTSDIAVPATNSTVKKIAFSAKKSDGFNPSLCICDEVASWEGDGGLKQYEVMKSGMGARPEGILLSCTTSGYINDSIYDELTKRATRFLLGDSKERKFLPFLYMIDDLDKWNDLEELKKANPNLGHSVLEEYMLEEIAVAEGSLSKKAEFFTKYCNIKQNSSLAWLSAQDIEKVSGPALKLEDFRGCYCVGGIDLSQTTDLTACVVLIEKNAKIYAFARFFMPGERLQDATERDGVPYSSYITRGFLELSGENFVDYNDCFLFFKELVEKYEILPLKTGYDRYSSQYLINQMNEYGFHTDDVYQGDNLWPVIQETEGLIKDGRIHIGDNDLLKSHLLNSAVKMSVERGRGHLVKLNRTARIDGTAALLDALTVRQKYYSEIGEQLKNQR